MEKKTVAALTFAAVGCALAGEIVCTSPDGRNAIVITDGERPSWRVTRDGKSVTVASDLGLRIGGAPALGAADAKVTATRKIDSVWHDRFGGDWEVRDRANETELLLAGRSRDALRLGVVLRAYDEGVAFRYVLPPRAGLDQAVVGSELTTFRFKGDPLCWCAAYVSHENSQEGAFLHRSLRSLAPNITGPTLFAQIPLVVETPAGLAAICEADLASWPGAHLTVDDVQKPADATALKVALSPAPVASCSGRVAGEFPFRSPWRALMLADDALGLLRCKSLVLNLSPAPAGGDAAFAWVKPGVSAWDWWYDSDNDLTTESAIGMVDFAAEMGWAYHTMDAAWMGRPAAAPGLKIRPRAGLDMEKILARAREKKVGIIVWLHWAVLEQNGIDETFANLERRGIAGVKIDFLNRQDALMTGWCEKVCRLAAKHHLVVNFHGTYHPTGLRRTWPNLLTREGIRGNEITKWNIPSDALNPATLVFTRFLVGPGDYTPGGVANVHARDFVCQMERGHRYGDSSPESVAMKIYAEEVGTRAHALALCVAFDSPLMTLCDAPSRYRAAAGAELLKNLPSVWRRTVPLAGQIGEYHAVARESMDGRVYLAVQTVAARRLDLKLDFLGAGDWRYEGVTDDPEKTPKDANAVRRLAGAATSASRLALDLDDEGGALVRFTRR